MIVLDVGAGDGALAKRMRDRYNCTVYALEPSSERSSDYEACVAKLGKDYVEKCTLQEALRLHPEKYLNAFNVVTIFKYNISPEKNDEFLECLSKAVKPGGTVYITSTEYARFYFDPAFEDLYLTKKMEKYFCNIKIIYHDTDAGRYLSMMCYRPLAPQERQDNANSTPPRP
jgi:cyclopropane fatty-acyl-phospholipid synthase-like methyltransferase